MSGSDSDGNPDPSSNHPSGGGGGADDEEDGGLSSGLHRSWAGLAGLSSSAGGGRVDGSFLTEPGSYEDFTYPSPFDYTSFAAHSPTHSAGGSGTVGPSLSRPFSPMALSGYFRTAASSNPSFSPLPSFSPYPFRDAPSPPSASASSSAQMHPSSQPIPPVPPTPPPPLFDEGETALFSSFLTTLDVDPNFLFNPVLPPGMPSPPSAEMVRQMEGQGSGLEGERERTEKEQLGRGVGGLSLSASASAAMGRVETPLAPHVPLRQPSPELEELEQRFKEDEEEDEEDGEETSKPDDDDDSDFEPGPSRGGGGGGAGTRRRNRGGASSGGGPNGRSGKKARMQHKVQRTPLEHDHEEEEEEDVKMAPAEEEEDEDDDFVPPTSASTATASGRPRRATRVPASTTTSQSNSRPSHRRPSLSKPAPSSSSSSRSPPSAPPSSLYAGALPSHSLKRTTSTQSRSSSQASPPPPPPPPPPAPKPAPLTESEKRSNHIASEQRRRNAIKSGFQDLVDLLVAGSSASGIVLGSGEGGEEDGAGGAVGGKKAKGGSGRGRGRKGEVQANASKSVVLEKARRYILWLERGNRALERECGRVEGALREEGGGR